MSGFNIHESENSNHIESVFFVLFFFLVTPHVKYIKGLEFLFNEPAEVINIAWGKMLRF